MSECRICFNSEKGKLVAPCRCKGSIEHIHQGCLMKWLKERYPSQFRALLRSKEPKNQTGIQCELCKYEYKADIKYLKPLQIAKKIKNSRLTYTVLINIPIIIYLGYKCNNLLRHFLAFFFSHTIHGNSNLKFSKKIFMVFRFYLGLLAKLIPLSVLGTVLPMILHSTLILLKKLFLEFKVVNFENII